MGFVELFLVAVGLSMDAFAVAICKGLGMKRLDVGQAVVIALFFGGFQALMPAIGWLLGSQFAHVVEPIDHWIAFALLVFIGGKMLVDALRGEDGETEDETENGGRIDLRELVMLAVATSIDALAVGVTFAFLQMDIAFPVLFIGATTFVLSFVGVAIGHQFGARWEKPSTIAGGIVLILIGCKILLEHLSILPF